MKPNSLHTIKNIFDGNIIIVTQRLIMKKGRNIKIVKLGQDMKMTEKKRQ